MAVRKVPNKTNLLTTQRNEQFKQHVIFDAEDRIVFVFSAKIDAVEGDPCLGVEYVYRSINSSQVKDMQEVQYEWKAAWESDFVFDPDTSYDPDGDGNL